MATSILFYITDKHMNISIHVIFSLNACHFTVLYLYVVLDTQFFVFSTFVVDCRIGLSIPFVKISFQHVTFLKVSLYCSYMVLC